MIINFCVCGTRTLFHIHPELVFKLLFPAACFFVLLICLGFALDSTFIIFYHHLQYVTLILSFSGDRKDNK